MIHISNIPFNLKVASIRVSHIDDRPITKTITILDPSVERRDLRVHNVSAIVFYPNNSGVQNTKLIKGVETRKHTTTIKKKNS